MTDTAMNTLSDERLEEIVRGFDGLADRLGAEETLAIALELQSLRSDHKTMADFVRPLIPDGQNKGQAESVCAWIGLLDHFRKESLRSAHPAVRVKGLEWVDLKAVTSLATYLIMPSTFGFYWSVITGSGGFSATERFGAEAEAKAAAQANYERRILSALDLSPAEAQCCMCGKTGLSTVEGDGGTECQLEDGRWTCSEPCWEKAGGYGPDLSPVEGEPVTWQHQCWFEDEQRWSEWRPGKIDRRYGSDWRERPLYAAPPQPVVTDEQAALNALRPFHDAVFNDNGDITVTGPYAYDFSVAAYSAYRMLTAALSVKPQSGSDKP